MNIYKKAQLLIVDSVINNYKSEFRKLRSIPERQSKLVRFMSKLKCIASTYGIAVVITNHVNSGNLRRPKPAGGNIMSDKSSYRICLRPFNNSVIVAGMVQSTYHHEREVYLKLSEKGIEDKPIRNL